MFNNLNLLLASVIIVKLILLNHFLHADHHLSILTIADCDQIVKVLKFVEYMGLTGQSHNLKKCSTNWNIFLIYRLIYEHFEAFDIFLFDNLNNLMSLTKNHFPQVTKCPCHWMFSRTNLSWYTVFKWKKGPQKIRDVSKFKYYLVLIK